MTKALEIEEHLSDVTINQNDEKSNDDQCKLKERGEFSEENDVEENDSGLVISRTQHSFWLDVVLDLEKLEKCHTMRVAASFVAIQLMSIS